MGRPILKDYPHVTQGENASDGSSDHRITGQTWFKLHDGRLLCPSTPRTDLSFGSVGRSPITLCPIMR